MTDPARLAAPLRTHGELATALRLLAHFTAHNTAPCRLDTRGWCLPHWHYTDGPCPHGEAQALLARHQDPRP